VRDGDSRDYEMVVVREATGARIRDHHEPSLRSMASRYAEVRSLGEVLISTDAFPLPTPSLPEGPAARSAAPTPAASDPPRGLAARPRLDLGGIFLLTSVCMS
jgi:hypothetical protein